MPDGIACAASIHISNDSLDVYVLLKRDRAVVQNETEQLRAPRAFWHRTPQRMIYEATGAHHQLLRLGTKALIALENRHAEMLAFIPAGLIATEGAANPSQTHLATRCTRS
jgi:hypothetical protein